MRNTLRVCSSLLAMVLLLATDMTLLASQSESSQGGQTSVIVVPAGTRLEIRLSGTLSTESNETGDVFEATLDRNLMLDGRSVIPKKSRITGRLVEVKESGRVKGRARMTLTLREIRLGGESYEISTNNLTIEADGSKGSDAKKIGAGAGLGALLGVITGGGGGAALGSVIGAGGGTAGVLLTKGKHVTFNPEHLFVFRLEEDLRLKEH